MIAHFRLPRITLLALVLAAPCWALAATVWVADSSEKIGRGVALPERPATSAALSAAKNEFEAFQIAVSGGAGGVSATATPLVGPGGESVPAPRLFREALIEVKYPSSDDGGPGWFPDALVPDVDDVVGEKRNAFPFDVPDGETRAIWAEVHVPADAPPGTYRGSVTVHGAGSDAVVPVALEVWDFGLPSTSSLRSHFGLYFNDLIAAHHVPFYAPEFSALRAAYSQLGLDHRISLGYMDDGTSGLEHFVKWYGPLCDGTAPTQLVGAQLTTVMLRDIPGQGSVASQASAWASLFRSHALPAPAPAIRRPDGTVAPGAPAATTFTSGATASTPAVATTSSRRDKTWFDKLFDYTCDEPPMFCSFGDIAVRSAEVKAGDAEIPTLVTSNLHKMDANGVTGAADILVPIIDELDYKLSGTSDDDERPLYDGFLASRPRREVWTYQSCDSHGCGGSSAFATGWPSYVIDAMSMRARAEEWLSFRFDLTGELYWDATWAYEIGDPWESQWASAYTGNGDGTLFYPGTIDRIQGKTEIPIASLRLKMIREGMEDFEYLKALADAGDAKFAHDVARTLFPNAWTEPSAAQLLAARRAIAERIVALRHGARLADLPTTLPETLPVSDLGTDPATAPPPIVKPYDGRHYEGGGGPTPGDVGGGGGGGGHTAGGEPAAGGDQPADGGQPSGDAHDGGAGQDGAAGKPNDGDGGGKPSDPRTGRDPQDGGTGGTADTGGQTPSPPAPTPDPTTPTPAPTPTATPSPTPTPSPSATPTPTPPTPAPTPTPTATPTPTPTPTATPSATPTPTPTATPSVTPTPTPATAPTPDAATTTSG